MKQSKLKYLGILIVLILLGIGICIGVRVKRGSTASSDNKTSITVNQ